MNKIEFNKLDIKKQIEYFNKKIKILGNSTAVSKELRFSESTIRSRFKSHGYKLNSNKTEYIIFNKSNTKIINKSKQDNYKNDTHVINEESNNFKDNIIVKSEEADEIRELLNVKNDILKIVKLYKNNEVACAVSNEIKIDVKRFDDEKALTKAIRIYPSLLTEFRDFCKQHAEYKIQDMLSMALIEYMEKYK